MPPPQALAIARQKGLDLVEISPTAVPPVCRIMDFGKYQYQEQKRTRESKKHQRVILVKEIKFRPKVDEHDYQFKKKHIERFLNDGDKVKATIFFRGREMAHPEIGQRILERLLAELADVAIAETMPRQRRQPDARDSGAARRTQERAEGAAARRTSDVGREETPGRGSVRTRHAEAEDTSGCGEAVQEDGHGQGHPGQRLQAPHPDEQDDEVEAADARDRRRSPKATPSSPPDAALQVELVLRAVGRCRGLALEPSRS